MKALIRIICLVTLSAFHVTLLPALPVAGAHHQAQPFGNVNLKSPNHSATRILQSGPTGIVLELNTSPFFVADDESIQVSGLEEMIVDAGAPALPYYSTYVAIPPEAQVSMTVTESGLNSHHGVQVLPVATEQLHGEIPPAGDILAYATGSIAQKEPLFLEDKAIYNADRAFPGVSGTLSEPMYMRDIRMVELRLYPLQYNPLRNTVTQASKLLVNLNFSGAKLINQQNIDSGDTGQEAVWREKIINFDQVKEWRALPANDAATESAELPIGATTYKIEVDQNGIYEILGSDLAAKGLELPVDPTTIQMMQGGTPVAYQFVDTNNNQNFDAVDKIRFYGWAFSGSRQDKLYVTNNVFWLWAGGEASHIPVINNQAGTGPTVTSFRDSITEWQERHYASAWSVDWDVNDPTSWHTRRFAIEPDGTEHVENIDLPNPVPNAQDVSYLVELTTHLRKPLKKPSTTTFDVETFLNSSAKLGERSWTGPKNLNILSAVSANILKQPGSAGYPTNQIRVKFDSNSPTPVPIHITRITIAYTRQLVAIADQLIFGREEGGPSTFKVSGFTNNDPGKVLVWDISNPHAPQQISMQASNITGSGGNFTYLFGRNHAPQAKFIATTNSNILNIKSLSVYKPVSIDPPSEGARWLAITHSSLRAAADDLAAYRHPQMGAYVVNIENVVNQVGYGFHTPETIRQYLRHAIRDWKTAPRYVTLFGDATNNPRNLPCADCPSFWSTDSPTLIATDLKFVDRWQGMIPSDFALSLLFGDDLIPDIAMSRMPANTNQEAANMVQKVITYETQREDTLLDWQKNVLFVADNADEASNFAGDFCDMNNETALHIPDAYNKKHLCLEEPTVDDINDLRAEMRKQVSDVGLSIINYRGHGSTANWAGYNNEPPILSKDDTDFWINAGRAAVVISADCLDGYFILNHESSLSETFLRLKNRGSVAHWSAAGLGYTEEHSVLHKGFYDGIFKHNQFAIGDAVNFAKIRYHQSGRHPSELYGFVLLGDAAMKVVPGVAGDLFLPVLFAP